MVKCPKCRNAKVSLTEFGTVRGAMGYVENGTYHATAQAYDLIQESMFDYTPISVEGTCMSCGHNWVCKKLVQLPRDGEEI
jgi:predicted nucleic-acid-binding Zn-ribbon protein